MRLHARLSSSLVWLVCLARSPAAAQPNDTNLPVNQTLNAFPKSNTFNVMVTAAPTGRLDFAAKAVLNKNDKANRVHIGTALVNVALLCGTGTPLLGEDGALHGCSPNRIDSEYSCPFEHWCHVGSSNETTYCCPKHKRTRPCEQAPSIGFGTGRMRRFWFNGRTHRCQNMTYTGYGGNENNFVTRDDCERFCLDRRAATAIDANLLLTNPPTTTTARPTTFATVSATLPTFPRTYPTLPDNRLDIETASVAPRTRHQPPLNPCQLLPNRGQGASAVERWYFNAQSSRCEQFSFLGNGANLNNFQTQQHCYDVCGGGATGSATGTTACRFPTSAGAGQYEIQRWTFNQQSSVCQQFTYSGCCGNANRFATLQDCTQTCSTGRPDALPRAETAVLPRPILLNPCRSTGQGQTHFCGGGNAGQPCPSGSFCQLGNSAGSSVCCPQLGQGISQCVQPVAMGSGTSTITRWFYNAAIGRCQSFVYRGLQGNENNFITYDLCMSACALNPCGTGDPYRQNGQALHCSALSTTVCPPNYYCHIGPDTLSSVCCPAQGNVCEQPSARGGGQAQIQRWTFNGLSRTCEPFIYTGVGGNQNNFRTLADCRGTCGAVAQPCALGEPAQQNGQPTLCSTSNLNACPTNFFCHIGAGAATTVCCRSSGSDACRLSLSTGNGNAVLSRWYFDAATSTCRAFTYTGLGGNENNYLSLAECRRACPEYDNPCPAGTPPRNDATGQVQFCSAVNRDCPATYWCHIGASRQTTVCCPFPSNPCVMPQARGTGIAQLPRYFYNQMLRQCEIFTYTGKGGNQNNFGSRSECETTCPILDNPCTSGLPATTADGSPQLCSTANPLQCPATFWCHIGSTPSSTVCCPGAGDPCRMPLARGNGNAVINRWYYNTDTKTCLSFTYTGRGGNQNNFVSLTGCRQACPEFQNPCSTGQPHIGLNGQITHCGATTPSICPTTFWCHVGGTLDTSVCCPGAGNPCDLPLAVGNGNAVLLRYFYDTASQTCQQFRYTGFGGNENNFMTEQACERRCPVFRNPCAQGPPARNADNSLLTCSVSNLSGCPTGFWCHVGNSEQTTLCCPGATDPCNQPLIVGTGQVTLPRYYFNSLTQQCLPYTYSGIGGNQNNFLSRVDCQTACPVFANPCVQGSPASGSNGQYVLCTATTPNVCPAGYWCHISDPNTNAVCCPGSENPCLIRLATGTGAAALPRWYFDTNVRRCNRFTYGGSGGNQNNFLSMQDCQLRCPEFRNPCAAGDPAQAPSGGILFCSTTAQTCPATFWCHVGADSDSTVCCPGASDPCLNPLVPGTGSARLSRWYFNQNTRQCLPFTYTGRGGNQNSFISEAECTQRCPVFRNPCLTTLNPPEVLFCSAQNQGACPAGYWCHVGAVTESSVCCPGSSDPCEQPLTTGTGTGFGPLTRWHYDSAQLQCRQFEYTGLGGNQNNFLTRESCQQKCPEFVNPCFAGEPYRDARNGLVRFCNVNRPNDCPANFWCHVGANQQSTVCCAGFGDPCTAPLSVGAGAASLPRWFFNANARRCQQFAYTGVGGNQNNFLTQLQCQRQCPEFSNPCGSGTPLTSLSGQITYCSAQNPNICPLGYYCHVGIIQETTLCCPERAADPCNLPLEIGGGIGSLNRYHFNQLNRRCEPFSYTGVGGNGNNFPTQEACRRRCPEFTNPCDGLPYRNVQGQVLYCNANSVCPPSYFCHHGGDTTTTMCCPSRGNPCSQAVIIGSGRSQLTRFYYNAALRRCVGFVYSGVGGNENNFRSQPECEARCTPAANPCALGSRPYVGPSGAPLTCGSATGAFSAICPTNYYCHVGVNVYSTICCPTQSAVSPCQLPLTTGTGDAQMQRWYFDVAARRCQLFTYNGRHGNENNFATERACQSVCSFGLPNAVPLSSTVQSPCAFGQPLMGAQGVPLPCNGGQCSDRNYACQTSGSGQAACCPNPSSFCLQPRNAGSCRPAAALPTRYGYNPATDSCVPFKFSGCGGNMNNFDNRDACTGVCARKGFNLLRDAAPNATSWLDFFRL